MQLREILKNRRSCRSFKKQELSTEQIDYLKRAIFASPISFSETDDMLISVITDSKVLSRLSEDASLTDFTTKEQYDPFYGVPLVIFVSTSNPSPDHIEYANAGVIMENVHLASIDLGLGSVFVWSALRKIRTNNDLLKLIQLPEDHKLLLGIAVGHPSEVVAASTEWKSENDLKFVEI